MSLLNFLALPVVGFAIELASEGHVWSLLREIDSTSNNRSVGASQLWAQVACTIRLNISCEDGSFWIFAFPVDSS